MRAKWSKRTYIDLFAGSGRCLVEKVNEEIDGSALITLKCKIPFSHYFFNDLETRAIYALKVRTSAYNKDSIKFFNKDCNEVIEDIRKELPEGALNFCFIDPTNWQISFDSVRRLTEGQRMDLSITFHIGEMKRVLRTAPESLADFFGDKTCSFRAHKGSRALLDAYEERLKSIGYTDIHDLVLLRNTKRVPLYYLLFASKHPRGKEFWDKIIQKVPGGQLRLKME